MRNLKITAHMGSAIATYDNWSPALDSLLVGEIANRLNLYYPNPTPEQVNNTRWVISQEMPIEQGEIGGEWYYKASSPCYTIASEFTDRYRKRWDNHENNLNWGKRKAKWQTSEGGEKNYDLPLYCRNTPSISWYAVGDKEKIASLLRTCTHIGKKRSYGNGLVVRWEIAEIREDWHLFRDGKLMRPMPKRLLDSNYVSVHEVSRREAGRSSLRITDYELLTWGWRPPAWLHSNKELCVMPKGNVCSKTSI